MDSDISSVTTNEFFEWVDIESSMNVKKGMGEDAMAEEEESKNVQSSATENEDDNGENVVTAHIHSASAVSARLSEAEEEMCYECNIPIVAFSLRRAKGEV